MLTEVLSLKCFASALYWASQQDKHTLSRQMVALLFFLTVYIPVTSSLCGGTSLHSLSIIDALYVMLAHLYIAVNVKLCTALNVKMCMQVSVKRVLGIPFAHIVRSHPALVKLGREEVFAEYVGQQHSMLYDV